MISDIKMEIGKKRKMIELESVVKNNDSDKDEAILKKYQKVNKAIKLVNNGKVYIISKKFSSTLAD